LTFLPCLSGKFPDQAQAFPSRAHKFSWPGERRGCQGPRSGPQGSSLTAAPLPAQHRARGTEGRPKRSITADRSQLQRMMHQSQPIAADHILLQRITAHYIPNAIRCGSLRFAVIGCNRMFELGGQDRQGTCTLRPALSDGRVHLFAAGSTSRNPSRLCMHLTLTQLQAPAKE